MSVARGVHRGGGTPPPRIAKSGICYFSRQLLKIAEGENKLNIQKGVNCTYSVQCI